MPSADASSTAPTRAITIAPPRMPFVSVLKGRNSSPAASTPARMASPPRLGVGNCVQRALARLVDRADAVGQPRRQRRQQERHGAGDQERPERVEAVHPRPHYPGPRPRLRAVARFVRLHDPPSDSEERPA